LRERSLGVVVIWGLDRAGTKAKVLAEKGIVYQAGFEGGGIMADVWGAINLNNSESVEPLEKVFVEVLV
jgi:hypothetical protein